MPSSQGPRAAGCAGIGRRRADTWRGGGGGTNQGALSRHADASFFCCFSLFFFQYGCWLGNTVSSKPHTQASKVAHLSRNCREGLKGPQAVRDPSQPAGAPASAAGGGGAAGASYTTHLNRGRLDKATRAAAGGEGGRGPDGQDEEHTAGKGAAG